MSYLLQCQRETFKQVFTASFATVSPILGKRGLDLVARGVARKLLLKKAIQGHDWLVSAPVIDENF